MNLWPHFRSRLQSLFQRTRLDRDMAEEIETHLAFETERNLDRGMSPREARAAALRRFGGVEQTLERERDARGWRWLDDLIGDLRYGTRQLRGSPVFTLAAVTTLALGIGGTTAIFSVVHALLLHPLPYPQAERLVLVSEAAPTGPAGSCGGSFHDWSQHAEDFAYLGAVHTVNKNLTGRGEPRQLEGWEVTADYLRVLGIQPALGRPFVATDDEAGGNHQVALLTHNFWQREFGGDSQAVGDYLQLDGASFEIIGVLPPKVLLSDEVDYLSPAGILSAPYKTHRNYGYVTTTIGLLKPGHSREQATTRLTAAKQNYNALYPAYKEEWTVVVEDLQESLFGSQRQPLYTLLGSVAAVLLIACVNVANLILARTSARQPEIAMRLALGATRGRLVRQLLTESLLLSALGGAAGLLVASLAIDPLVRFSSLERLDAISIELNRSILLFTVLVTLGSGIIFGLLPALRATRQPVGSQLKDGNRNATRGKSRLQSALIVAETALTVVLLVVTGLLLRSLHAVANADTGFTAEGVLTFQVTQSGDTAQTVAKRLQFSADVLRELEAIPGVSSAGVVSAMPMNGRQFYGDSMYRADRPETVNDARGGFDGVAGNYFQTLDIPLLRGRLLEDFDNREDAPKVMVVSQAFVDAQFEPDEEPIGSQIVFKGDQWEIVGVVGSIHRFSMESPPTPQVYLPQVHFPWNTFYVVRTALPPLSLAPQVRAAVQAVNPNQPIAYLRTLKQAARETMAGRQQMLTLLGLFALVALLLAIIGIYGVMAYTVHRRVREIGIRIALGATPRRIYAFILRDGMRLVLLGLGLGAIGAVLATQAIASSLYNTGRYDPAVLISVSLLLLLLGSVACVLPARRAIRLDPLTALSSE